LEGFNTELTQEEYNQLGGLDSNLLEFGADKILEEDWVRSVDTSDVTPWFIGETNAGKLRRYADFSLITGGRLELGAQAVNVNVSVINHVVKQSVALVQDFFKNTLAKNQSKKLNGALNLAIKSFGPQEQRADTPEMREAIDKGFVAEGGAATTEPQFNKFTDYLDSVIDNELLRDPNFKTSVAKANVSPVIQYPLPQQRGIVVKGDFIIEDDDKSRARLVYITNFRTNDSIPKAHDGYGIAVMPNIESGKPNLFITDNNALADDLLLAGDKIYDGTLYENYLEGANMTIDVGTKYNYELIYGVPGTGEDDAVTLEVRVWDSVGARPGTATMAYGAYVPMNLRAKNVKGITQSIEATDFGFGILQSDGFTWSFGPVEVLQGTSVYAQALFMMDTSNFTGEIVELFVGHQGLGSNSGAQTDGSIVKIVDFNTPSSPVWETVTTNTTGTVAFTRKSFDVDRYSDADDYMFVLITSQYPYDAINDINSKIISDYVSISKVFTGYNVGSKVDAYIQKISSTWTPESETYVDFMAVSGSIALDLDSTFNLPITKIENVEILDGGGSPTAQYLTEYQDYRMISVSPTEDGSVRENKVLLLSNYANVYNLRVRYKYISNFDTMQAFIDSQSAAASRTDILLKHPQIKYIDVSFNSSYTGQDLIDAIKDYVYKATSAVRAFDIIALAVSYGAQSGSLTSMSIQSEFYDSDGNLNTESSSDELTRTRIQVFVPKTITIT
ncbi:MAG: hypothetical protein GWP19_12965, partial [Planctomycetia bacterium]|nr:hypothetical protein [Planctomycetia bacterium]